MPKAQYTQKFRDCWLRDPELQNRTGTREIYSSLPENANCLKTTCVAELILKKLVKNMSQEYLLFHTMCSMGDSDIHTIKWLCSSSLTKCSSYKELQWTQFTNTNIKIAYIKRSTEELELYLSYPDTYAAIEIRTMQSTVQKQYIKIQSNELQPPNELWHCFAGFDFYNIPFVTVTIQIHITLNEKSTDNTLPDLSNLLIDPNYSDGIIESCDGVEFKIHKCVLAARSDVLKGHFTHSDESSIIHSKFQEDVLKELFNFIYSGIKAVHMDSVADRLFVAADFYQLNDLKSFCENWMYKQLTEDNVIDTLVLADLHSADNLKNLAMDFLHSHAKVVFSKPAWADLESPEILKTLYENGKQH